MKNIIFIILSWLMFIMPVEAATARPGGHFVLYTTSDPKTFNDIVATETSSTVVTSMMFEGLTTVDPVTLQVLPHLASHWEHSSDGLTWIFHLRRDVRWFDGEEMNADDVVFTFNELIFNEAIPSSARDIFTVGGKAFKVEKIDLWTVKFILPTKFAPFLRGLSQPILPEHRLKKTVQDGKFVFAWGIDVNPLDVIGTGPFKLVEYKPGERLSFKRNSLYWKKSSKGDQLPYLEKLTMLIIPSNEGALLRFIDGNLDYLSVAGTDYPLLKPLEKKNNFTIYEMGADFGSNFLVFNQNTDLNIKTGTAYVDPIKSKWFRDVNFRKAIAHAIDKDKLISILSNGFGYPQYGPLSPSAGFFYNANVIHYPYDLKLAQQLLDEAGYRDRKGDGIIEDSDGNPVEFSLMTPANSVVRVQTSAIIAADLRKIGIKVNLITPEFNVLVGKLMSEFNWEAVVLGLTGGVEPHFGKNVWHSTGGLHMWYPRQTKPATSWEKRIDEIFDSGVQELNETQRKALYDEYQEIVSNQLPVIYTVLGARMGALRNRFGNIKPTGYGGVLHNIEEIYVK